MPIVNCPSEIVDLIAQFLPRNSFLALRRTCKDLHKKCEYHLTTRHLKQKRVILAKQTNAGLDSLIGLAHHELYAARVQKIALELEAYHLLPVSNEDCACWEPAPKTPTIRSRRLDIAILLSSLMEFPNLQVLEAVNRFSDSAISTGQTNKTSFTEWLSTAAYIDKNPSRLPLRRGTHLATLYNALIALAGTSENLGRIAVDHGVSSTRLSALAQDRAAYNQASPMIYGPSNGICFSSLQEITIQANQAMIYHNACHEMNFLEYLLRTAPRLEKLVLNGGYIVNNEITKICYDTIMESIEWNPEMSVWASECLTSLNLGNLKIWRLEDLFTRYNGTLRHVMLHGLELVNASMSFVALEDCAELESLAVHAICDLDLYFAIYPWAFGDGESLQELRQLFYLKTRTFWEAQQMWAEAKVPDGTDPDGDQDMTGWRFEGSGVMEGVRFLAANGKKVYGY
ncbi:hypothetical protein BU16DRAFT_532549 [Lophium mytilinum]|uniref:F-box domain-containing protein n=1 Tax=Lophium mytilinum TaxID=390894 RepID=A0A6A6RCP1_9PEZI|nr:hypothetical protein BU16DRAFT_532549 [Lophium mytilinum]